MSSFSYDTDTICAVSTPPGVGGISIIRVSGPDSLSVVRAIAGFLPKYPESHRIFYGWIKGSESQSVIDQVLISYFAVNKSFTGEEVIEISCHGGIFLSQQVLSELIKGGCRLAEKGEFTYRAFLNNKMDLVQAESILSLIEGKTEASNHLAIGQLRGDLSKTFGSLEDTLIGILAHLEANIDFSQEDIEIESQEKLIKRLDTCLCEVVTLTQSYTMGRIYSEGLKVALLGPPNVGKSSLLNTWVGSERSIVTDEPGTTRDFIEGEKLFNGVSVTFIDTAGLRDTVNPVELIGITKAMELAKKCDFIFCLLDLSVLDTMSGAEINTSILDVFSNIEFDKLVVIGTKKDLLENNDGLKKSVPLQIETSGKMLKKFILKNISDKRLSPLTDTEKKTLEQFQNLKDERFLAASRHPSKGLKAVEEFLASQVKKANSSESQVILQTRHFQELCLVKENIERAIHLMKDGVSPEFPAFDLKEAVTGIQQILGKEYDDELLDKVFNEFCLGK